MEGRGEDMGKVRMHLIYLSGELESPLGACNWMGYVREKVPNRASRVSLQTFQSGSSLDSNILTISGSLDTVTLSGVVVLG
jgi:hypothetical protein